jgi:hypothetical protein
VGGLTRRLVSVALLLILGVCIAGPALDPEFELPAQHFDGDGDDSGHVGDVFACWIDGAPTGTLMPLPSAPIHHRIPDHVTKPPLIAVALAPPPPSLDSAPTLS